MWQSSSLLGSYFEEMHTRGCNLVIFIVIFIFVSIILFWLASQIANFCHTESCHTNWAEYDQKSISLATVINNVQCRGHTDIRVKPHAGAALQHKNSKLLRT